MCALESYYLCMVNDEKLLEFAKELLGDSFAFRPHQLKTIKSIVENVVNGTKQTVLEAPTGSGKSIIGIVAAYALYKLYEMKSYILTSDLSLFEQYKNDLKHMNMRVNCFGWIKGKENYVCYANGCGVSQSICSLRGYSPTSVAKDDSFNCRHSCEYVHDYIQAVHAPITLMTYQLYFIQRNYVESSIFKGRNMNFPKRDFVICDEAHKICDICQAHFAPVISILKPSWMETLDSYMHSFASDSRRIDILSYIELSKDNDELFDAMNMYADYVSMYCGMNEVIRQRLSSKKQLSKKERQALKAGNMARQEHCKLEDMASFIKSVGSTEYLVKTTAGNHITLNFVFDDIMLKKYFHGKSNSELLMSATIGDASQYAKLAGLDETSFKHISMPSSFDFSQSPIYYSTINRMSYAEKNESFKPIAMQVIDICKYYDQRRGIIQTGSYANCDDLMRMLPREIAERCLVYKNAADKSIALSHFVSFGKNANDNHILVGPTLVEGLDFPDDLCRFQICIKVPFAHLGNEYVRKKRDCIDGWYQYDAMNKICQGIGRGIRHPNDWCKTYILDGCINSLVNQLEKFEVLSGRFIEYECCESSH